MQTLHNLNSVRIGSYRTPSGMRDLHAVRVDGEVTIFDIATGHPDGDEDPRIVEEGLVAEREVHALAREYLGRARRLRRPLVRAA